MQQDSVVKVLLEQIRVVVAEKRSSGLYPPGLEQELEYEFREILERKTEGPEYTIQALKNLVLDKLAVLDHLSMMIVELESRIVQLERSRKS